MSLPLTKIWKAWIHISAHQCKHTTS